MSLTEGHLSCYQVSLLGCSPRSLFWSNIALYKWLWYKWHNIYIYNICKSTMIKHYTYKIYIYIFINFDKQLWHIPKIPNRSSHFKINETHPEKYVGLADGLYVGHCMLMLMFPRAQHDMFCHPHPERVVYDPHTPWQFMVKKHKKKQWNSSKHLKKHRDSKNRHSNTNPWYYCHIWKSYHFITWWLLNML